MTLEELKKKVQPVEAVPDNTRNEAFQVFGEKSVEGNNIQANAL